MARETMPAKTSYVPGDFEFSVRRSSAGLGLFAEEVIPRGACVIEYTGRVLSKEEEETCSGKYLFEVSDRKTIDGSPRSNTARYINHSCKPNCEPIVHRGKVLIMAKRKIQPSEELTYNYGKSYFETLIGPNGCRCAACAETSPARRSAR
jgi:SET domain-containing protein